MSLTDNLSATTGSGDLVGEIDMLGQRLALVRERIGRVIFGQREVVDQALTPYHYGYGLRHRARPGLQVTRRTLTATFETVS